MKILNSARQLAAAVLAAALLAASALPAFAVETQQLELDQKGSISVTFKSSTTGELVSGGQVSLYKVASITEDLTYEYAFPFYGDDLNTLTDEELASAALARELSNQALSAEADNVVRVTVPESGKVVFDGLEVGLYLIKQTEKSDNYDTIKPFLVSVPLKDSVSGLYQYDVDATPKVSTVYSDVPDTPPETPETPETPDTPETPVSPDTPTPVEIPETPTTPTLPQTGQLNWPVPVLACCGLALVLMGAVIRKRS